MIKNYSIAIKLGGIDSNFLFFTNKTKMLSRFNGEKRYLKILLRTKCRKFIHFKREENLQNKWKTDEIIRNTSYFEDDRKHL